MKKTAISTLIFLCTLILNAQNNIVVTVSKSNTYYHTYITTTITNKNIEAILIPVRGISDNSGIVINGGSSYIRLNAYNDSYLTATSQDILISQYNSNSTFIKIMPNQSYKQTELLFSSNRCIGYFDKPTNSPLKFYEATVHLVYFYFWDSNPTTFTADFVSTKVAY